MVEHEALTRYIAAILLVAIAVLVLGEVKRDSSPAILRETAKNALYIYGGAVALGVVAYLICLFK